jgi:hypothetical protein
MGKYPYAKVQQNQQKKTGFLPTPINTQIPFPKTFERGERWQKTPAIIPLKKQEEPQAKLPDNSRAESKTNQSVEHPKTTYNQ